MFSPERVGLIALAVSLVIYAVVALSAGSKKAQEIPIPPSQDLIDSLIMQSNAPQARPDSAKRTKIKKKKSTTTRQEKPKAPQRSHLDETL